MTRWRFQRAAALLGALALALYAVVRFRGAIPTFFFLDDFWVMRDAARIRIESLWDITQFFHFAHPGFLLYRPLSTTAYAYLLNALFDYDSSGYHAFQLLVFALNVVLAYAIAHRLTRSTAAAFAVGLLYLLAPGQAVNAYWLSAFTVTGTALWVLLLMWAWLIIDSPRRRAAVCALLQIAGLLASEHAISGPALLAVLALARREPWRRAVAALAVVSAPVALYISAKVWYLATRQGKTAYELGFDPITLLRQLGMYFSDSFNILKLSSPGDNVLAALGASLLLLLVIAVWRDFTGHAAWRLVGVGLAIFTLSLLPVLALRAHYYAHYICLAALGSSLSVVGCCNVLTDHWRPLALSVAMAVLAIDFASGESAWRDDPILRLVVRGSRFNVSWVERTQNAARAGATTVLVPANATTGMLFTIGQIHTYFPDMPEQVRRFPPGKPPTLELPGRAIVRGELQLQNIPEASPQHPAPGWEPRWDWLRRLAASPDNS